MDQQPVDPAVRRAAARKRVMFSALGVPLSILAMAWGMFLLRALFDVDLVASIGRKKPSSVAFYFWLALAATPIVLGYAWFEARKAIGLLDHGEVVTGSIVSVGKLAKHGMVPVRYRYTFRGQSYTGSEDVMKERASEFKACGNVSVRVNRRKPSHSALV